MNHRTSLWDALFHSDVLRGTERDERDVAARRRITVKADRGDLAEFRGSCQVDRDGSGLGAQVRSDSEFDLGMPLIADLLDPIALDAFADIMTRLIRGLFGPDVDVTVEASR